jgi:electron transfer flavoprotein alpha subunit
MRTLVVAEHDGQSLRPASLACMAFAQCVAEASGGSAAWLILGDKIDSVAAQAAGHAHVLAIESPRLAHPLAEPFARIIAHVAQQQQFELVCAASSTYSKDILPRAAALLGGRMASDVLRHELVDGQLVFDCPQYAGAVTAILRLVGTPQVVTVRASAYIATEPDATKVHEIERLRLEESLLESRAVYEGIKSKKSTRPDVTEAQVVVSGGRAIKNAEDFELLVGGLADAIGGATGSSRALVDAGITPNELQVGQTGKIVAPQVYIALGISGAVQHLAGMKNSRTIVAINNDANAPIFDMVDFGLVGDVYAVVPELIEKLQNHAAHSRA